MGKPWRDTWLQRGLVWPLSGKYYGTRVDVGHATVTVWDHGEFITPSVREVSNPTWDEMTPEGQREYHAEMMSDTHYETQADYELACLIADAPLLAYWLDVAIQQLREVLDYHRHDFSVRENENMERVVRLADAALARALGEEEKKA